MKVAVVGCGHVGLVTAVGLAHAGHEVVGIEADPQRLSMLERSEAPFHEPGVAETLPRLARAGKLRFTGDSDDAARAEIVMIAVGTPSRPDGSINLDFVKEAVQRIANLPRSTSRSRVIVIRSTVVPGTAEGFLLPLLRRHAREGLTSWGLAVNPEFLREGRALADFEKPDRIVIGQLDNPSGNVVARLYKSFKAPVIRTSLTAAETIKYASNALLATLVSFSNQMALLCEALPGVDVEDVLKAVHLDRRLSPVVRGRRISPGILDYLKAGCGFGGSCLPKDLRALIAFAREKGVSGELLESVNAINLRQPLHLVDLAESAVGGFAGKLALVLGLSYKAGTDDIRESPGIAIAEEILRRGAKLEVYDPLVNPFRVADLLERGAAFAPSLKEAMSRTDVCILTTAAPEFKLARKLLDDSRGTKPVVVDGRRLLAEEKVKSSPRYIAIGRQARHGAKTKGVKAG
jgi:UDPglucose 6-dehydrogenase